SGRAFKPRASLPQSVSDHRPAPSNCSRASTPAASAACSGPLRATDVCVLDASCQQLPQVPIAAATERDKCGPRAPKCRRTTNVSLKPPKQPLDHEQAARIGDDEHDGAGGPMSLACNPDRYDLERLDDHDRHQYKHRSCVRSDTV